MGPRAGEHEDHMGSRAGGHEDHMRPRAGGLSQSWYRSKRPKRRSATSRTAGRLVAPITITCEEGLMLSINVSSWETSRRSISPWAFSRLGAIASISSIKMIDGELACSVVEWLRG